jgi:hypothetical protein
MYKKIEMSLKNQVSYILLIDKNMNDIYYTLDIKFNSFNITFSSKLNVKLIVGNPYELIIESCMNNDNFSFSTSDNVVLESYEYSKNLILIEINEICKDETTNSLFSKKLKYVINKDYIIPPLKELSNLYNDLM